MLMAVPSSLRGKILHDPELPATKPLQIIICLLSHLLSQFVVVSHVEPC